MFSLPCSFATGLPEYCVLGADSYQRDRPDKAKQTGLIELS